MFDLAMPACVVTATDAPPVRLIADLARLVVPGDRAAAVALVGAR